MSMKDLFYPMHPPVRGARRIVREEGKNARSEELRAYYQANRDKVRAKQREYYLANRERMIARAVRYKAENPEHVRAVKRNSERYRKRDKGDTIPNPD